MRTRGRCAEFDTHSMVCPSVVTRRFWDKSTADARLLLLWSSEDSERNRDTLWLRESGITSVGVYTLGVLAFFSGPISFFPQQRPDKLNSVKIFTLKAGYHYGKRSGKTAVRKRPRVKRTFKDRHSGGINSQSRNPLVPSLIMSSGGPEATSAPSSMYHDSTSQLSCPSWTDLRCLWLCITS